MAQAVPGVVVVADRGELGDDLAVVLSGRAEPLRALLHANPPLAVRSRTVVDFPGCTPGQLGGIRGALADEAGLMLTPAARLAARLLDQVTADALGGQQPQHLAEQPAQRRLVPRPEPGDGGGDQGAARRR